jgi:GT2 family glycosyltransferase
VEYTRQCLEALIEHTPSELYEVIIVDNGSTDGTGNFLATLEGDVKLITNAQNLGFSKACNQGAQAAAGAYLVFLNNDTVPHEHWLTELIDVADALDDVAVVGGKLLYPDGTIQHAGVVTPPDHLYRFMRGDFPPADKPRDFQIVTAACMLIRRSVFFDVGGFDDLFINGGEDVDLCLKIREHGYRVFYNPRSVLTHYESVSEGRHNHLQHNLDLLEKRYAQTVKLDREDYLKQDGFVLEERDGEPLWVYHEDLCRKTISVVIVTYNSRPYIGECLAAIQTQTHLSFEIIIIDNNSTDGTRDYLKDLQGFKVLLNDENVGFSREIGRAHV